MPLQITNLAANSFATFVTTETEIRISQIQNQFDIKKRSELIRQCGEYLRDEAAFIFIVFADEPYGASKKVGQWPTLRITPQNFAFITRP
jgi:ABC-type transport system substrate-binding protein